MSVAYFTFGHGHAHALNGFTFDKDVVVRIESEDPRSTMLENFGGKWAFEYEEPPDMRYFPRGIVDLQGTPLKTANLKQEKGEG